MRNDKDKANALIKAPQKFELAMVKNVKHDEELIIWNRYKKIGVADQWGGEHFSFTYDPKKKILKSFMHLENEFDVDTLPTEEESEVLAFEFLKEHAPDLLDSVEVRWIRPLRKKPISPPHDEGFTLASGRIITGMRVKYFIHSNGKYAWVIVGKDGRVISFERDIVWSNLRRCRLTEKWLHDNWAKEKINLQNVA